MPGWKISRVEKILGWEWDRQYVDVIVNIHADEVDGKPAVYGHITLTDQRIADETVSDDILRDLTDDPNIVHMVDVTPTETEDQNDDIEAQIAAEVEAEEAAIAKCIREAQSVARSYGIPSILICDVTDGGKGEYRISSVAA
jgi:hypothetical protein